MTSVTETHNTLSATSSEQDLETAIDAAGVYQYRINSSVVAGGTTPDVYEFREYIKLYSGEASQVMEGSPITFTGGLCPALIEFPIRSVPANCSYKVTAKKLQGGDRSIKWSRLTLG